MEEEKNKRRPSVAFFDAMGVPDPIDYLRGSATTTSLQDVGRLDSNEDGNVNVKVKAESAADLDNHDDSKPAARDTKRQKREVEDPPARERPEGDQWPYRETLSFTRSLVFYGAGSITTESVKACKVIQECRDLRKKYFGSRGTIVVSVGTVDFQKTAKDCDQDSDTVKPHIFLRRTKNC